MNTCEIYVPVVIKPFMNMNVNNDCDVYPIPPRSTQPVMFDSVNTSICEDCIFDSFDMDDMDYCSEDFDGSFF